MKSASKPASASQQTSAPTPLQRSLADRISKVLQRERRPYPLSLYLKVGEILRPKIERATRYHGAHFIEGIASQLEHWGHRRLRLCVALASHQGISRNIKFLGQHEIPLWQVREILHIVRVKPEALQAIKAHIAAQGKAGLPDLLARLRGKPPPPRRDANARWLVWNPATGRVLTYKPVTQAKADLLKARHRHAVAFEAPSHRT